MSRLEIESRSSVDQGYDSLAQKIAQRMSSMPLQQCLVEYTSSLAHVFAAQSCGKCTPCRVGSRQICNLLQLVLEGNATANDVLAIKQIAQTMVDASDCAIGFEAGKMLLQSLESFKEDFQSHVEHDTCAVQHSSFVPCQDTCPAHVNIPGYIALIAAGRNEDALRVIRNDNPLPTVCGYVCEHPCEVVCRRALVDDSVNICGLKRYAADNAQPYSVQENLPATGKSVGIVGGGPAGLTAAYYLQLMGHAVTIYEQRPKLGGMVRYGIPDYRLPQEKLDADIAFILSTGVTAQCDVSVGKDIAVNDLLTKHDVLYLAIGAHGDKTLGIEGEKSRGVMSAVEFLRAAGNGAPIDLTGKRVAVVGGGNVAMDCARTAKRLGSASVEVLYRRRIADMTALAEEIEEAQAEGVQISQLKAPVAITFDENDCVTGITVQPQLISLVKGGRPSPKNADQPAETIPVDVVLVAIGQAIESDPFAAIASLSRDRIVAASDACVVKPVEAANAGAGEVAGAQVAASIPSASALVFAGGDAVSGPATVIKAIAAGKVAAANIDQALGFAHDVHDNVELPPVRPTFPAAGRVNLADRPFAVAAQDFDIAKIGMSAQAAAQESSRCLHCDHHGYNSVCGKEVCAW